MRAHERSLAALTLPRWTSLSWAAVRMLGDLPGCTEHFFSTHLSPPLTLQVFIGCYYKSMTSIFSISEDLSLCAPPTCFLIGDHHLIRVFSYTEGSLPCYIKRLEATWCELRYHYKQLKNTNCGKPDLGIQQNMQEVLNMCEAFFPPSYQNKAEKRPCKSPCFSLNI